MSGVSRESEISKNRMVAGTSVKALAPSTRHPFFGVLLSVIAALLFACMDTTTKYLVLSYPVPFVVAVRYVVFLGVVLSVLTPSAGRSLFQTQRTGLVLGRAACLGVGSLLMTVAFQRMPVAEATAVAFLAPMIVVLISGPLLQEKVGVLAWVSSATGFLGILLIARPSGGLDPAGVVFALCAAFTIAAYQLLSRLLAHTERTGALLFYTALVGTVLSGLLLPWFWSGRIPSLQETLLFIATGVLGAAGHFLFTAAYRHAPASLLAPMTYVQLVWAGLLGWLVFGHMPDAMTILGMCVVAASGALIALKSHRSSRLRDDQDQAGGIA